VPTDNDLVVALSIGLPVGLGIYLAWVHRDWSAQSKGVGLAGTWLGVQATAGLTALVTAILGSDMPVRSAGPGPTYRRDQWREIAW
jgi:hypothetical protein